jgi:hypothetical protein
MQVLAALDVIREALAEGSRPEAPLVEPHEPRPGRACPVHLRELVRGPRGYRCPIEGCRAGDVAA